jgi:protein-S-isoprenylcysteine O-methyltransferase Ste14
MPTRAKHLILAFFLFPVQILIVVPSLLIWHFGIEIHDNLYLGFWLAKPLIPIGFGIAGYCTTLFFIEGEGTPAPWMPPTKLMVTGPYRYVRNPMIIGVLMILMAEALLFTSLPIAIWLAIMIVAYMVLFIYVEEPALEKRFGDDYLLYKANVGRWFPRFPGWTAPWLPVVEDETDSTAPQTKD